MKVVVKSVKSSEMLKMLKVEFLSQQLRNFNHVSFLDQENRQVLARFLEDIRLEGYIRHPTCYISHGYRLGYKRWLTSNMFLCFHTVSFCGGHAKL